MDKQKLSDLAIFGGEKLFSDPQKTVEAYTPEWHELEDAFEGIFDRRFFSNNGPKVRELDEKFAEYLGVRNAICMTNSTLALMIAIKVLGIEGEIILPAFTFHGTVQTISFTGLTPVFCDVSQTDHIINAELIEPLLSARTCAVLGVHTWGRACDPYGLEHLCKTMNIALLFDATQAVGCSYHGNNIGGFGQIEIFSFQASSLFNGANGGCLTTNDDELAKRLRAMRNFHSNESSGELSFRMNGKMSEAQAVMALISLKNLHKNVSHNRNLFTHYKERAQNWESLRILDINDEDESNFQFAVFKIDPELQNMNRDLLYLLLRSEGIQAEKPFYPSVHCTPPYHKLFPLYRNSLTATNSLCANLLRLPIGNKMEVCDVEKISDLLDFLIRNDIAIVEKIQKDGLN